MRSGWLLRERVLANEERGVNAAYITGDIFNLDCLVEPVSDDLYTAAGPVELVGVDASVLADAITKHPALAFDVVRRLVADADWLREAITAIGRLDALDRLLVFIGQTRRRLISADQLKPDARQFRFPLTQLQIAEVIGVSAIHANRTVRRLQDEGIATIRGKRIWIDNLRRIEDTLMEVSV